MREIMTAAGLREHKASEHGRDYRLSDDGYGDMAVALRRGWRDVSGWGRDGWNLGDWPYVMVYFREAGDKGSLFVPGRRFELMTVCEGDHTMYAFESAEDRDAATDYLFLWYAAGERWAPLTWEQRAELDAGTLVVDEKFRGPYRTEIERTRS